jgi:hypothetical protein
LAQCDSGAFFAGTVLEGAGQNVLDIGLRNPVSVDVRFASCRIDEETEFHEVILIEGTKILTIMDPIWVSVPVRLTLISAAGWPGAALAVGQGQ